jgi:hypothetical protein
MQFTVAPVIACSQRHRFRSTRCGYLTNMSEDREAALQQTEPEQKSEDEDDRGIETTSGEPNTFEPEEDPDAAADAG